MTAPQPPAGYPAPPPKKGLSTGAILGIIVIGVVVLCGGGCGSLLLLGTTATTTTTEAVTATGESTTTTSGAAASSSTTAVVAGPGADEVLAAFTAAGLAVPNPRDNTAGNCGPAADELHCTKLVTTDILSIHEWADPAEAAHFVEAGGAPGTMVAVGPTTTVRFATGGSTPPYDRSAYEAVLATLG